MVKIRNVTIFVPQRRHTSYLCRVSPLGLSAEQETELGEKGFSWLSLLGCLPCCVLSPRTSSAPLTAWLLDLVIPAVTGQGA